MAGAPGMGPQPPGNNFQVMKDVTDSLIWIDSFICACICACICAAKGKPFQSNTVRFSIDGWQKLIHVWFVCLFVCLFVCWMGLRWIGIAWRGRRWARRTSVCGRCWSSASGRSWAKSPCPYRSTSRCLSSNVWPSTWNIRSCSTRRTRRRIPYSACR